LTSEAYIQQQTRLALARAGSVMHRNNVGQYTDQKTGRPIRYGLCVGSSDLIGWTPVTITLDMVGRTLAVFTAVEVKTPNGRPTEPQLNFIAQVTKAGGFAGIARSPGEAVAIAHKSAK
jgi:hypothetical protein